MNLWKEDFKTTKAQTEVKSRALSNKEINKHPLTSRKL